MRRDARGSCSCGWSGPWRSTDVDADHDVKKHCAETGCKPVSIGGDDLIGDDLMPHERDHVRP